MFQLVIILCSFVVLANTKECKAGFDCESRCCTILGSDVVCRQRCLGLSCELDVHCDGDCCVNSVCSSCLLQWTGSQNPKTTHQRKKYKPIQTKVIGSDVKTRSVQLSKISSPLQGRISRSPIGPKTRVQTAKPTRTIETPTRTIGEANTNGCSHSRTPLCSSGCCVDGQCVDFSYCVPIKAARIGRGGGGRRGGGSYRGGGGDSYRDGKGAPIKSLTVVIILIVGILLFGIILIVCVLCCAFGKCKCKG